MAYTYSHLFKIKTTGLRFFTVYGPWGRPDMAMFLFTDAIIHNRPIKIFNEGNLSRDFTYISDIITGIMATINDVHVSEENLYQLFNIGNSKPVKLLDFVTEIENNLDIKAEKIMLDMQPGDVNQTWADVSALKLKYHYQPKISIKEGVGNFVVWYKSFYNK
jgi:UDP-glucuronate 4-epimerase